MEIGAWPKFPSQEIFLSFEIPTPISPIPDLENINDETAKVPKIILCFMLALCLQICVSLELKAKEPTKKSQPRNWFGE